MSHRKWRLKVIVISHKGTEKKGEPEYYCDLCKERKLPYELYPFWVTNGKLEPAPIKHRDFCQSHLCIDCRNVVMETSVKDFE